MPVPKNTVHLRVAIIAALLLIVTALHYLTTTQLVNAHDVYRRLYYVPIVFGGLWFALRGGMTTSILASLLYMPHVLFHWQHNPTIALEQYLEIILYNVIGCLTGFLAERERRQLEGWMDRSMGSASAGRTSRRFMSLCPSTPLSEASRDEPE